MKVAKRRELNKKHFTNFSIITDITNTCLKANIYLNVYVYQYICMPDTPTQNIVTVYTSHILWP